MLSVELMKSLGLYVDHKGYIQFTDSELLTEGTFLGYTEDELIFTSGGAEERFPFEIVKNVFYKGYVTSYQKEDMIGRIDDKYIFRLEDCADTKMGQELLRHSEYEFSVCCHLEAIQDKSCAGALRIVAKDVNLEQEPCHVLPMEFLKDEVFLYKLRRREDQIGVLEQKGDKYAVCYEGEKTGYFYRGAIADIIKCPKVNEYVSVFYEGKNICGVVASAEMKHFCVFTAEQETVRISYKGCKWIRYWGRVIEETLTSGEKQFLIDGVYPVTESCRKGVGQGRGKTGLKHGMTVSYMLGVNRNGCFVREYSIEEEQVSLNVGVITSLDSSGKGYIGSFYERGAELREEDARAFFFEEDFEKQIMPDLLHFVYIVKYNTVKECESERVTAMEVSEIYDRSSVSSIRIKEDGEVCVIPRERDELCYYINHEVLVVRKERGDIVEGRCIHIDEAAKKMVLLCGDGAESEYRAIAFEEIAAVRELGRMGIYGGQKEEVLEERQVVILDYHERKGFFVMNRDAYESDSPAKKMWYYLPFDVQAEAEALKKEYYRYDYPATVRVSVKNGELQKVLEIGEGYEKQDASNFFPATGKRRRYGFIVAYNKQLGYATICDAYYPKGSEEEVNLERKKVVLTNSGWDERMNSTNKHIYFVTYEEAYEEEKEEYVFVRVLSIEMYPKKQILSAKVVDGRPEFIFMSDIEDKEAEAAIEGEAENGLSVESTTATELSTGETVVIWDTAYEVIGRTKDEKLKVRTIPYIGKKAFEQDMTRERLAIYRFGMLTGIDKGQGIVYMDDYLKVPVTRLDERAALAFGSGKKKVVVSYLWDTDGSVKEVSIPKKELLDTLPWRKGIVSAVLSENVNTCTVLIRLEEEDVTAEYHFSVETKQNVRRRNFDFVGEPVYVRAVKAACGPKKDLDVKWYALDFHFVNETVTVNEVLKGRPQGDPIKSYVVRVENVKYPADMEYADYWAEHVADEVNVRLVPYLSETEETEILRAVPFS